MRLLQLITLFLVFATSNVNAVLLCGPPPVPGPPEAPLLVTPTGSPVSLSPNFVWDITLGATWYYLWVDGPAGNVYKKWFRSTNDLCGCECSAAPAISLDTGEHTWWVRTYNSDGYGSWSEAMNFMVTTDVPAATTLESPAGNIKTANPAYTWNAVSNATWYYLWVNDFTGTPIKTWYSSTQSGCASGTGTCSITPSQTIYGPSQWPGTWWVRSWNANGNGPWSDSLRFHYLF